MMVKLLIVAMIAMTFADPMKRCPYYELGTTAAAHPESLSVSIWETYIIKRNTSDDLKSCIFRFYMMRS